jgi:lipoate-protein ligase A
MPAWRLILDGRLDGEWNMAFDRAVQQAHAAGEAPATLRLYGWSRPTVSLGRFQRLEGIDSEACRAGGLDVVRRFTGGRGVLHDDEVTYSVVAGLKDGVPRGVVASYAHLSGPLVAAYRALGVEAALNARPRGDAGSAACYLHASKADLSAGRSKLAGSAQVWLTDTCLQHGSVTLTRDVAREARVFKLDERSAAALARTTAVLDDVCERLPSREVVTDAICRAFSEVLGVCIEPGEPTGAELDRARSLLAEVRVKARDASMSAG